MRRLVPVFALLTLFACKRDLAYPEPEAPEAEANADTSEANADADTPGTATAEARPAACAELSAQDCALAGEQLLASDTPSDAIAPLDWACTEGIGQACSSLALGYRVATLPAPAAGVLLGLDQRGCEAHSDQSCRFLGVAYYEGNEVAQDFARAQELFSASCERDDAQSCLALGLLAFEGKAGPRDLAAASVAFERACALDHAESCYNLGVIATGNAGGEPDLEAAAAWMARACELGDGDGCEAVKAIAAAAKPQGPVANANVHMGSIEVDGMTMKDLECRITGGGGLFGTMALLATLGERKKAFDKCAPKGAEPVVHWSFAGSKTTVISVEASSPAIASCVEKAMAKVKPTMNAECSATLVLGSGS